jgi:hypothetical protein
MREYSAKIPIQKLGKNNLSTGIPMISGNESIIGSKFKKDNKINN